MYIYINYAIASNTSCNSLALFTGIATVNKEMFIDILRWFKDAVRRKDPEKWRTSSWVLLYNAPAHKSVLNKDFSAKINATTLERPPYSPDPDAVNFYLFPRLKSAIKRRCFCDAIDINLLATDFFFKF